MGIVKVGLGGKLRDLGGAGTRPSGVVPARAKPRGTMITSE